MVSPATPRIVQDFERKGFSSREGTPNVMRAAHWHNEVEINYLLQGHMTYLSGGRHLRLPTGALALHWGGVPHQVVAVTDDARCLWFNLPLAWFLGWDLPTPFVESVLTGQFMIAGDPDESSYDAMLLRRWHRDMRSGDAGRVRIVLLEFQARVGRLAATQAQCHHAGRGESRPVSAAIGRVEIMMEYMARHYRDRVTLADVAAAAELHPNYATTLFKTTCGMRVNAYLTRMRVSHAQRLLVTTDWTVLAIAEHAGFHSLSRFYEAFQSVCQCTPNAYRKSLLAET